MVVLPDFCFQWNLSSVKCTILNTVNRGCLLHGASAPVMVTAPSSLSVSTTAASRVQSQAPAQCYIVIDCGSGSQLDLHSPEAAMMSRLWWCDITTIKHRLWRNMSSEAVFEWIIPLPSSPGTEAPICHAALLDCSHYTSLPLPHVLIPVT